MLCAIAIGYVTTGICDTPLFAQEAPKPKNYTFSNDNFSQHIPIWEKYLSSLKGKPNLNYLEVGVYEGRSFVWMLDNILTDPSSRATAIDIFPDDLLDRFKANVKKAGADEKVSILSGYSYSELRKPPLESFDIIYIDGSHTGNDVLGDAAQSLPLLKDGGILLFDDYALATEFPPELNAKTAIDAFITVNRNYIDVLHKDWQVIMKKHKIEVWKYWDLENHFIRIGPYLYFAMERKLFNWETKESVALSEQEIGFIETLLVSRKFGDYEFTVGKDVADNEDFKKFKEKLKLDFVKTIE